ncbi:MAG: hypothetical protein O2783_02685 [Chloroflexi bacterium]|nr:hypothetical protein [Chloroflexota bacterium]
MRRFHLFELEDKSWLPKQIRDAGTDLVHFMWQIGNAHKPIVPRLREVLVKTGAQEIIDLGSGGGGPVVAIYEELVRSGCAVRVTLTDKFPNIPAFKYARERSNGGVDFLEEPVDATAVPPHLSGLMTMFASLHHFRPEMVRGILRDAVEQGRSIAVFDLSARRPPPLSMMLLANPIGVLLVTPLLWPFRWSRLFWTYVIPVVPLYVAWDAFVSGLRLYSIQELQELVEGLQADNYTWEIERERFGGSITCLIGCPLEALTERSV